MSLGCVTSKMNAVTPTLSIFRECKHAERAQPGAVRQHPQSQKLEREEEQHRDDEDHERGSRRQAIDQGAEPRLHGAQRDVCDDPGNDRGEMAPKPRLEEENEGQQDQERAKQAAHAYT
jgi:hypothetical protein